MYGEISKRTGGKDFEKKHFESVNMQMGRVQLDSDWNEAMATLSKARSRSLKDVIGKHGSPNDGFRIGRDLILDHMDVLDGWNKTGSGSFRIDHLEKAEGRGSFRIEGDCSLTRSIPHLLTNLPELRKGLEDAGAAVKLLLNYEVCATEDAKIQLSLKGNREDAPTLIPAIPAGPYSCNGWQQIEFDLKNLNLDAYTQIVIQVTTSGVVHLDRLALNPGLIADSDTGDFYIQGGDGSNDHAGRYYADGLACIKEGFETYCYQQDYPEPLVIDLNTATQKLVYLDVWHRTITAVEDPEIREVALGGPDTCAREQLVAQVKFVNDAEYGIDLPAKLRPAKSGTLTNGLPAVDQSKCDFLPDLDYTGLNNSLYRIEIHKSDDQKTTRFKWSRNNGSDLTAISSFDKDDKNAVIVLDDHLLCPDNWVELCDDVSDLADAQDTAKHSKLARITKMEPVSNGIKITLENKNKNFSTEPFSLHPDSHPKLRSWHGVEDIKKFMEFDRKIPAKELEHGIRIAFDGDNFYHGDYWQFTARVNTHDIEALDHVAPMGPRHHYAPLSVIKKDVGKLLFESCRRTFSPLTALSAVDISFDADACASWSGLDINNVQQALEYLSSFQGCADQIVLPGQDIQEAVNSLSPEGGTIFLTAGIHLVKNTIQIHNRRNITIYGDGTATRVIYFPQEPAADNDQIKSLKESIDKIQAQMKAVEDKPEEWQKLKDQLDSLEAKLALLLADQMSDLFRITSSQNISFKNILMFTFAADSLVAILEASQDVQVTDCDLLNLPYQMKIIIKDNASRNQGAAGLLQNEKARFLTSDFSTVDLLERGAINETLLKELEREVVSGKRLTMACACIRVTKACKISINDNRLAAEWGVMQQGKADALEIPVLNGLNLSRNSIYSVQAGLELITARKALIEDNQFFDITLSISKEELKKLIATEIILDNLCPTIFETQLNDFIDELLGTIFKCEPDLDTPVLMKGLGIAAYALSNSSIVNNRMVGRLGIVAFYSQANTIYGNHICANKTALRLIYNFSTRVEHNNFKILSDIITKQAPTPKDPLDPKNPDIKADENKMKADAAVVITGNIDGEYLPQPSTLGLVEVHFSDSLIFKENKVQGPSGWIVCDYGAVDYANTLKHFANIWNTPLQAEAEILLLRYFLELMGLGPTTQLLETVLKIFNSGKPIDLAAYLIEDVWGTPTVYTIHLQATSKGFMGRDIEFKENPFIKILVKLFDLLLTLKLVSRTRITHNYFEVDKIGIGMSNAITLGGTKLTHNRIAGAGEAAIFWQAQPGLNNPELNGLILEAGYDIILLGLHTIKDALERLLKALQGQTQTGGNIKTFSPWQNIMVVSVYSGIGQLCPNDKGQSSGTVSPSTDPTPFVNYINELIQAIEVLINQLEAYGVRKGIEDLASADDQISLNQIHGGGDGIHNNLANCLIDSNRISVDPGKSAIAELFGIGRLLSGYAGVSQAATSQDHTLINALGNALMNLNPNALQAADALLAKKPEQWLQLDHQMFTKIKAIATASPLLQDMTPKITSLQAKVAAGNTPDIKTASAELITSFGEHLTGFGMILEAPGVQVLENQVESKATLELGENQRRAPGGILMTGESNLAGMIVYGLLVEEVIPIFNLGGQGTRLAANSLQWGTGHGLCFSFLPAIVDLRIENNEIQNHGLAGILCDGPILSSMLTSSMISKKALAVKGGSSTSAGQVLLPEINAEIFTFLFMLDNLRITDNEINQCYLNDAIGFDADIPPSSDFTVEVNKKSILNKVYYVTLEGALTVRRAAEVYCLRNNIRGTGTAAKGWYSCASLLVKCYNVKFEENKILNNGRSGADDLYCPRGGAFFLGAAGSLTILNNDFNQNTGVTLMVVPDFSLIFLSGLNMIHEPKYDNTQSLERLLVLGNEFDIQDTTVSYWAKVHLLDQFSTSANREYNIYDLTFSQNQVSVATKGSLYLAAKHLLFNGNIVNGNSDTVILLYSFKGLGIGNILPESKYTQDPIGNIKLTTENHNIFT